MLKIIALTVLRVIAEAVAAFCKGLFKKSPEQKVADVKKKQLEIAAKPVSNPDDLLRRMRDGKL